MFNKLRNCHINTKHALLASIILIFCSILLHNGGVAHPEIYTYLPHYLSDGPVLNKLYDSKVVDMNLYQARELSYFFDYLDCKFIELCARLGFPHFLSVTTYVFLLATAMLLWWFCTEQVFLGRTEALLFIILFWTSPSIFLGHNYFRTAKVGVTLLSSILFVLIYQFIKDQAKEIPSSFSWSKGIGITALSFTMTLFDRQGIYFIVTAILFIIIWFVYQPNKNLFYFICALLCSLLLSTIYNYIIGPYLTFYLNHYSPNFSYQHLRLEKFFNYFIEYSWAGTSLYIDTLRFLLGNLPAGILTGLLIILLISVLLMVYRDIKNTRKLSKFSVAGIGIIVCSLIMPIGLNAVMVLRHTPLFDEDVRRVYYWMPEAAILSFTFSIGLGYWKSHAGRYKFIFPLILGLMVIGNIYSLPRHNFITTHGHMKDPIEYTPLLLESIQNINNKTYSVPDKIAQDKIYLFFAKELGRQ